MRSAVLSCFWIRVAAGQAVFPFFGSISFIPALKSVIPSGTPLIGANVGIALPFEITIPDPAAVMTRMRRTEPGEDRWILYQSVAWFLGRLGINGEACIKRTLCEVASSRATPGLMGDVMRALFT